MDLWIGNFACWSSKCRALLKGSAGLIPKYVIVRVETGVISLVGLLVSSPVTNSPHPASSFVTLKPNLPNLQPQPTRAFSGSGRAGRKAFIAQGGDTC